MASPREFLTRSPSSQSSASSNILVASATQIFDEDELRTTASTPPTSLSGSIEHCEKESVEISEPRRRSDRVRRPPRVAYDPDSRQPSLTATSRSVSGLTERTLVNDQDNEVEPPSTPFGDKMEQALNMDWELPNNTIPRRSPRDLQRKPSVKEKMKQAAKTVSTVLGKRGRDVVEAGKRTLSKIDPIQNKILKQLDMGKGGVLDEMDLDLDFVVPPPPKKVKTTPLRELAQPIDMPPPFSNTAKAMKKWQKEGLYVGQASSADKTQKGAKKTQKTAEKENDDTQTKSFMSLPMFNYLDKERDFVIPYDIYAPTLRKGDSKPKDWHQLNKNRLIGDARELWGKDEQYKESSYCFCQPGAPGEAGCDEDCLNRAMQYECNPTNCRLHPDDCGNRHFAELAKRMKKGGAYDHGVEILPTGNRGYGIRACRSFAPGQVIMEYTGEVITEVECQRRMREEYKNKQCYYLMELERGLVIDGTRGSKARFINHSCAPNCEVRMLKVNGTLRMGVFAGDAGVFTGEELSYDYNFDNFGTTHQPCYCGASTCRGYLGPRLNATEKKKQEKEELEARKKAADEARRKAERQAHKKKVQDGRGSGWRGWVAVDDPETKARLRMEKAEREAREITSSRAQRMAARQLGHPAIKLESPRKLHSPRKAPSPKKKVQISKRRRPNTIIKTETIRHVVSDNEEDEVKVAEISSLARASANTSKFHEQLSSPLKESTTVTATHTEVVMQEDGSIRATSFEESIAIPSGESALPRSKSLLDVASQTARDGRDAVRSVSQAVKKSLKEAGVGSGKLRQSTLNFARLT